MAAPATLNQATLEEQVVAALTALSDAQIAFNDAQADDTTKKNAVAISADIQNGVFQGQVVLPVTSTVTATEVFTA